MGGDTLSVNNYTFFSDENKLILLIAIIIRSIIIN